MSEKPYLGLRADQAFAYADPDTLLIEDEDLGLCTVDLNKPSREQVLVPVDAP